MGQWSYLAVLLFIVAGTLWLEVALRTRVLRRGLRLLGTLIPVLVVFLTWDAYAIAEGHWWFDGARVTGWQLPLQLPVEEALFFVVVPTAAILTLEAVRSASGLRAGDEVASKLGSDEP
jgi:lycopene cyclase domain-containing protein